MVSSFYTVTDFLARLSLGHPSVKSFGLGSVEDIDVGKNTMFPRAYTTINDIIIGERKTIYNITYFVVDRVADITPESTGKLNTLLNDYRGVDNSIDVWNTTLEVISDVYAYILANPDALEYEVDGEATVVPFKDRFQNLLAGHGADFSIVVPNPNNICTINI